MTRKEALKVLIQSSARDIKGMGLGYRSTTEEWRIEVREAIEKMYKEAYDSECDKSVRYNLGL